MMLYLVGLLIWTCILTAAQLGFLRWLDIKLIPMVVGHWRTRKTRREMAETLAVIRAEEYARNLAKRDVVRTRALKAIAESAGVRRIDR
jgi:hypothetical protein